MKCRKVTYKGKDEFKVEELYMKEVPFDPNYDYALMDSDTEVNKATLTRGYIKKKDFDRLFMNSSMITQDLSESNLVVIKLKLKVNALECAVRIAKTALNDI